MSQTLIDVAEFRERFDVDGEIKDTRLKPHIRSASTRLRQWVTDTVYTAVLAEKTDGEPSTDRAEDLCNAEAHLAMHFAILGLNTPFSSKGVVSLAMAAEGRERRQYLPPEDTKRLAEEFLEIARSMATPYIAADGAVAVEIVSTAGDCCLADTSCEAVTRRRC